MSGPTSDYGHEFYRWDPQRQHDALAALARGALASWELEPDGDLALLAERENTVFSFESEGERYVARVHRAGYHSDAQLRSQVLWARALEADSVIHTAPVLDARDGEPFAHAAHPDVPEPRQVTLMRWVPGRSLEAVGEDDTATLRRLGEMMAALHDHAEHWRPPPDFELLCWDADGLIGEDPQWGRFWTVDRLDDADRALLSAFRDRARAELDKLGTEENFGLIHGDFLPDNILVDGDELTLLDFDDAGLGWHLFDVATALAIPSLSPDFPALRDAFVDGYRARRSLGDDMLGRLPLFLALRGCTYVGWMHTRAHTQYARDMTDLVVAAALGTARDYLES